MLRFRDPLKALPAVALLLAGCGADEPISSAVGSYSDVAVLTDLDALGPVARQIERSLEVAVDYSLRPEPLFEVDLFDMRDRRNAEVYKNVVVVGLLGGRDDGSEELRRRLGGETLSDAGHRDLFVAVEEDVYSRNQLVFYVAGRDRGLMQSALARNADLLIHRIESANRKRLREFLFSDGHEAALEQRIRHELGFSLQVPASYRETRFYAGEGEGLVEVAAVRPTRAVSVYFRADADSGLLEDRDALLELRRAWGRRFLDETLQDAGGFTWTEDEPFGEREVLMLGGFWEARAKEYGGPFRTLFFHVPEEGRLYGVNLLTYAPGMDKHTYMREAMAVAETLEP